MVLDEVQRVPDLLLAVKRAVDRERQPGRYILTGFANLLLMKSVSESLAGRAAYLSLWPMTRRERLGQGRAGLSSELLGHSCEHWPEILNATDPEPADWR
jgi:predicted AAA+ superfamily ATPase